jgi:hypothetical protein
VDLSNGFAPYIEEWHANGYEALETPLLFLSDRNLFRQVLRDEGFAWIPQVFSNDFIPAGTVAEHLRSLRSQIEVCLEDNPLFINGHTGSDTWSHAEAEDFYGATLEMEAQLGVAISHETHRLRYFSNPWNTHRILEQFPSLKLTCDYSHWVCVAERLLQDCGRILERCAEQCWHLHARVGFEEGPQVPDPRAPEWSHHLEVHEQWWQQIWNAQQNSGREVSTLTPEFGPPPYMHTIPYTQAPVADLNSICNWMAQRQRGRFEAR